VSLAKGIDRASGIGRPACLARWNRLLARLTGKKVKKAAKFLVVGGLGEVGE
jgi:hypothetical protein